jgi:hypothetical protein
MFRALKSRPDDFSRHGQSLTKLAADDTPSRPVVTCHMGGITAPDLATIDALCRLRVSAAHLGYVLRLRETTSRLDELLALCGLDQSPPVGQRQPEEREETLRVEEEVEPGNAAI